MPVPKVLSPDDLGYDHRWKEGGADLTSYTEILQAGRGLFPEYKLVVNKKRQKGGFEQLLMLGGILTASGYKRFRSAQTIEKNLHLTIATPKGPKELVLPETVTLYVIKGELYIQYDRCALWHESEADTFS